MFKKLIAIAIFITAGIPMMQQCSQIEEKITPHELLIAYKSLEAGKVKTNLSWQQTLTLYSMLYGSAMATDTIANACSKDYIRGSIFLGTLALSGIWEHSKSKEWYENLQSLNKKSISNKNIITIGSQEYLLHKDFDNIDQIDPKNHYEIYLMPKDEDLAQVFASLPIWLEKYKSDIDFIGILPLRGVATSACSNENLPRIIVGLKTGASKDIVTKMVSAIYSSKRTGDEYYKGIGTAPRYSAEFAVEGYYNRLISDKLIYVGYGSGDYKEAHPDEYTMKKKVPFLYFFSKEVDDKAYPSKEYRVIFPFHYEPPKKVIKYF